MMAYELRSQNGVTLLINLIEDSATYRGAIENETERKESNLDNMTLPFSDSDKLLSMDFTGSQRIITIRGSFQSNSDANIKTKADAFRNLIAPSGSGYSQVAIRYVSEFLGTKYVKIVSLNTERQAGVPYYFTYTLEMIEADTSI
jgi:hypothetical protein